MVSLRFPFLFSPPPKLPNSVPSRPFSAACTVVAAAAGFAAGISVSRTKEINENPFFLDALNLIFSKFTHQQRSSPLWCSISLADDSLPPVVESKTGAAFPSVVSGSRRLLGIGLRRKRILGLKNIDVYAFGVYVDDGDIQKYGDLCSAEVKGSKLSEDLMEGDTRVTVRLQIVYNRLSIRSVRNAFEESVGSRLQKLGGADDTELLQRFTSQFKDEYKIPQGSSIELSRESGHLLRTTTHQADEKWKSDTYLDQFYLPLEKDQLFLPHIMEASNILHPEVENVMRAAWARGARLNVPTTGVRRRNRPARPPIQRRERDSTAFEDDEVGPEPLKMKWVKE